ncbi:CRISPR-associated protein Cas4 [Paenibacillus sp. 481]|uniref:CRISPR-associated protein Cas4 n=1 Tax=Paenibacillus sp. 481 TaxID=2835869 RepID=UPI001E2A2FA9|nr:CRISPR-associated protein Cas4 [Paenibacillus sp. 481]UHA76069.1 CRISPR-associated protein Cas4 [Paenibacillus sp. 481]
MAYTEDELLALSGIQHYAYCTRQWALIHLEQQWAENVRTFEGRQLHQRVDNVYLQESRGNILIRRAVPLVSYNLGIYGVSDVVEFRKADTDSHDVGLTLHERDGEWVPYPVEYKRGKPKPLAWDELQLCAQAMCLEEMLHIPVPEGAIYYKEWERRVPITFHEKLRQQVEELYKEMHRLLAEGNTPTARYGNKCRHCSLESICVPKLNRKTSQYLQQLFDDEWAGKEET